MKSAGVVCVLAMFCGAAASGQPARVRTPRLGFVFTPSDASLRPISGLPATAVVEDPVALPDNARVLALSPRQDFVLAAIGARVLLVDLTVLPPTGHVVFTMAEKPDRAVLSPTGAGALVLAGDKALLLAGLPDSPRQAGTLDLSTLGGALAAVAVSDDSRVAVAVVPGETGSALFRLAPGQAPALLSLAGDVPALSFFDRRYDLVFADRANDQIWQMRDAAGSAELVPLAGSAEGLISPVAVRPYPDARRIAVLHSGGHAVAVVDLAGGVVQNLACPCTASLLERLGPRALFRLTDASDFPVWLMDDEGTNTKVLFVASKRSQEAQP